jgi:hypothetical protein
MKLHHTLILLTGILGCKPSKPHSESDPAASSAASSSTESAAVASIASVGGIRGVIRIVGDDSPLMPKANKIPVGQCFSAHKMHSKVFRKGADGAVADVLVAVTEYNSAVPLPRGPIEITMADCALSQRTVVLTTGQEIHAKNVGVVAAIPHLQGAPQAALVVAVPGGTPIVLTPTHAGRYMLVDASHDYATADVFVVNFPTFDVSDEQGKFEIQGIPAGSVKLSASLPDAGLTLEQRVVVEPNKTVDVALELKFDRARWQTTLDDAKAELEASRPQ